MAKRKAESAENAEGAEVVGESTPKDFVPPPGAVALAQLTGRQPTADVLDPTKVGVIAPGTLQADTESEAKALAEEAGKQVYIRETGQYARPDGEVGAYQPL